MKTFAYIIALGYLLPAAVVYFIMTFSSVKEDIRKMRTSDDIVDPELFIDMMIWCPIMNIIVMFMLIKDALFPPERCSTCNREKDDPEGMFCSNPFHLKK
jgi:hypothetical protein